MTRAPSNHELDGIAAWWYAKGTYPEAAAMLEIGVQTLKNRLYLFRRVEGAVSNLDLAMRYQTEIRKRERRFIGKRRKAA